jgi:hypothetical protein
MSARAWGRIAWMTLAASVVTPSFTGCAYKCSRNADCQGGMGACEPLEAWCENGTCQTQCSRTCRTDIADVSSCTRGAVCTDTAASSSSFGRCTVRAIPCGTAADCPAYRPRDDAGVQSAWSCADGACAYPGLSFVRGRSP